MGGCEVRPRAAADDDVVVTLVTRLQDDPRHNITYVGTGEESVRGDLADLLVDDAHAWVAVRDGEVVGFLGADVDDELGRCWWFGPWAGDAATARALLAAAEPAVRGVPQREFAPDSRNEQLAEVATELGYSADEPSAVLVAALDEFAPPPRHPDVRPLEPDDHEVVADLHDRVFRHTHTPGPRLVTADGTTVLVVGEPPIGYVATEHHPDGSLYVDFLGVERGARGRGLGRALVAAALADAADAGVTEASLTVRVGNAAARRLYASLGFVEERVAAPYRRGFTLDHRR